MPKGVKGFQKGDPNINRNGRTEGTKNFETDFNEAVDEIAKENNMTRSEARKLLLKVAFKQAKDGNYSFYKDIHDRIYGQATQKTDLTSQGGKIDGIIFEVINKKDEVENANEQGSTEESESTGEPEDQNNIERGVEQVN